MPGATRLRPGWSDDESFSVVRITEVQPEHLGAARRGALAVPEMAITVDE